MFDDNQHYCKKAAARIGLVVSGWHADLVSECETSFRSELSDIGITPDIFRIEAPGALEFPLLAKTMAASEKFDAIALIALVVDGGIYRHDFVAQAVIDGIVRVSLETDVPVLSAVLTPHQFHETEDHKAFFKNHLGTKGKELAHAVTRVLENLCQIRGLSVPQTFEPSASRNA